MASVGTPYRGLSVEWFYRHLYSIAHRVISLSPLAIYTFSSLL